MAAVSIICKLFLTGSGKNKGFIQCISRDRIRTTVNVLGDSIGAGVIQRLSRKELEANSTGKDMEVEQWDEDSDYATNSSSSEKGPVNEMYQVCRQCPFNTTYSLYTGV